MGFWGFGVLGDANLFFLNPNGIIFGPNAKLDIRGSFVASTASSFSFGNEAEYSATNPEAPPLLKVNFTPGLQIGGKSPGAVVNEGKLIVGKDLTLWGGSVTSKGQLFAPEGRLKIAAVLGDARVRDVRAETAQISASNNLILEESQLGTIGDLSLLAGDTVRVRDSNINSSTSSDVAGEIKLIAQNSISLTNSSIFSDSLGQEKGANIFVKAESLSLKGARLATRTFAQGDSGDLTIKAWEVELSSTLSDGLSAGGLFTETRGPGNAGDLNINTGKLIVRDGAQVLSKAKNLSTGKGGNLTVVASESMELSGTSEVSSFNNELSLFPSGLFTETEGSSSAGDIKVETSKLVVRDGARISTGTSGIGRAGNLNVNALESAKLEGTSSIDYFSSGLFALNKDSDFPGNISIDTKKLIVQNGAQVSTQTTGNGSGGNLTVNASDLVRLKGASPNLEISGGLITQTLGEGNAGELKLETKKLVVQDGALISAVTAGVGSGGNITLNASESIELNNSSGKRGFPGGIFTQTEGVLIRDGFGFIQEESIGDAGRLTIDTKRLIVKDGTHISSGSIEFGKGRGGDLTVTASEYVKVIGTSKDASIPSALTSETRGGTAGNLRIITEKLLIQNGGKVSSETFGSGGKGGDLFVNASELIDVRGTSADDRISSHLSTRTFGSGNAGNLNIKTGKLTIGEGGVVAAETYESGQGGNIFVDASEIIEVIGTGSDNSKLTKDREFIFSNIGLITIGFVQTPRISVVKVTPTTRNALTSGSFSNSGKAGNLKIKTRQLIVKNFGQLNVSSQSSKQAGNLEVIKVDSIILDNKGRLTSDSASGDGGNIILNVQDVLLMRNGSNISTSAGTSEQPGDGGNITINATNGFLIGVPNENSDITANAFEGSGGKIDIASQRIFWMEPRSREEFSSELNPSDLPTNDITAFSQQNPDLDGLIIIDLLNTVDPNRGLTPLPTAFVDPSELIDQTCTLSSTKSSSQFVDTGRGGLPQNPRNPLNPDATVRRVAAPIAPQSRSGQSLAPLPDNKEPQSIPVEAQGWVKLRNGKIRLVAQAPLVTPEGNWQSRTGCYAY